MSTANELRELKADELKGRVAELKQQIFDMRARHNTGVLDSTAELERARREVARILTVAREAELGLSRRAKTEKKAAPKAKPAAKPAKKAGKAKE